MNYSDVNANFKISVNFDEQFEKGSNYTSY